MILADIRDYIESLNLADFVYMGKLPDKKEKSIGVYNSKHQYDYNVPIGGTQLASYELKYVTLLLHWNESPRDTENAGKRLFEAIASIRDVTVNDKIIKFVQPLYQLQNIETDDFGVYEMVIEAAFVCGKE